jgi:glycosyltransferase involved in cell wall biosynthesis
MKVLINGLQLGKQFSGVQYYLENFLQELVKIQLSDIEITVLLPKYHKSCVVSISNPQFCKIPVNTNLRLLRIGYENLFLNSSIGKKNIDILHCPAYILPLIGKNKSIITMHDMIALDFPELCSWSNARYFKYFLPFSIKRASRIIAVSNKVKEDILRRFKIPEKKIRVIYHGIPDRFGLIKNTNLLKRVSIKYNLPKRFILFVGNLEPKKNLEVLVKAFSLLIKQYEIMHSLVIVGQTGWKNRKLLEIINKHKFKGKILLTGYVDEDDLPAIYNLATVFAFPSLYEGFGYPVLEAMACGTPVVCSNRGALPEISGGNCLFTDANSVEQLADRLYQIINVPEIRQDLIQRGLKWSKEFTMNRSATETLKLYQEISEN